MSQSLLPLFLRFVSFSLRLRLNFWSSYSLRTKSKICQTHFFVTFIFNKCFQKATELILIESLIILSLKVRCLFFLLSMLDFGCWLLSMFCPVFSSHTIMCSRCGFLYIYSPLDSYYFLNLCLDNSFENFFISSDITSFLFPLFPSSSIVFIRLFSHVAHILLYISILLYPCLQVGLDIFFWLLFQFTNCPLRYI